MATTTTTMMPSSASVDHSTELTSEGSFPPMAASTSSAASTISKAATSSPTTTTTTSSKASTSSVIPNSTSTPASLDHQSPDNLAPFVKEIFSISIAPKVHEIPAVAPFVKSISSVAPSVTLTSSIAPSVTSTEETPSETQSTPQLKTKSPSLPRMTRSKTLERKNLKRRRSEEASKNVSAEEESNITSTNSDNLLDGRLGPPRPRRGILTRSRSQLIRQKQKESKSTTSPSSTLDLTDDVNSLDDNSTSSSSRLKRASVASASSSNASSVGSFSSSPTASRGKDASTSTSPPRKRKCRKSDGKTEEPSISEVIDLPCEEMTDRQKMNVISDFLSKHNCILDKTLALSSLHKLHARICRRFKRAITHVSLLNNRIRSTGTRYKTASDGNRRSARYVLRMRLAVLEGVRTCFCEYAQEKAEILKDIERIFVREHGNLTSRFDTPSLDLDDADEDIQRRAAEEEEEEEDEDDRELADALGSQGEGDDEDGENEDEDEDELD